VFASALRRCDEFTLHCRESSSSHVGASPPNPITAYLLSSGWGKGAFIRHGVRDWTAGASLPVAGLYVITPCGCRLVKASVARKLAQRADETRMYSKSEAFDPGLQGGLRLQKASRRSARGRGSWLACHWPAEKAGLRLRPAGQRATTVLSMY